MRSSAWIWIIVAVLVIGSGLWSWRRETAVTVGTDVVAFGDRVRADGTIKGPKDK